MKPASQLWRMSVTTTLEAGDAVSELLGATFQLPVTSCYDVETGVNVVTVYGPRRLISAHGIRKAVSAKLKKMRHCGLKTGSGRMTIAKVRREDWTESWKRHFKPIEISDALLIKPSWSRRRPRKNQAVIVLDPGLSFGTGHHPTTVFCLKEIARLQRGRDSALRCPDAAARHPHHESRSFLDLGTGSGILAIAAAKLGYSPVRAIDVDPEAVRIARANARSNGVGKKARILRGDAARLSARPAQRYDLVCANLISDLLIAQSRRIAMQLNHHGALVLAGILKPEFARVQKAFEKLDLKLVSGGCRGGWRSGTFRFIHGKNF